jgi:FAD/FMN-containing dehydrogenase
VRGGGGNFGIVTAFEFGLHPMRSQVTGGRLVFPATSAGSVINAYGELSSRAPEELYLDLIFAQLCAIDFCWSGEPDEADKVAAPLRKLGTPMEGELKAIGYLAIQRERDRPDQPARADEKRAQVFRTGFVHGFDGRLARALAEGYEDHPQRRTSLYIQHAGGAIGRVAPDATAFPHRSVTHVLNLTVSWPLSGDDTQHRRYAERYWSTLSRFTDGYYANLVDLEPRVVEENYRGNLARLRQVKKRYDPTNLFRLNANIRPSV